MSRRVLYVTPIQHDINYFDLKLKNTIFYKTKFFFNC